MVCESSYFMPISTMAPNSLWFCCSESCTAQIWTSDCGLPSKGLIWCLPLTEAVEYYFAEFFRKQGGGGGDTKILRYLQSLAHSASSSTSKNTLIMFPFFARQVLKGKILPQKWQACLSFSVCFSQCSFLKTLITIMNHIIGVCTVIWIWCHQPGGYIL